MNGRHWGLKRLLGLLITAGGLLVLITEALSLTVL
jgi:hypothetical protein